MDRGGARGAFNGGAAPYRSSGGLTTRPTAGSDEIQLRIDPMHEELDDTISTLRGQVQQLRGVAQQIETETKYQNDFVSQLQNLVMKAQAGVKNNSSKLNKSIIKNGSNHIVQVVLFALFCFFLVYLWSKMSRR